MGAPTSELLAVVYFGQLYVVVHSIQQVPPQGNQLPQLSFICFGVSL